MALENLAVLERDSWFQSVSLKHRRALLTEAKPRRLQDHTRIYRMGDAADGLHVVLDGQVRLVSYTDNGTEIINIMLKPGRWFGELSVLDRSPRPQDAIAIGQTRIGTITLDAIDKIVAATPAFWRDIALLNCAHFRSAIAHLQRNSRETAIARLASLLIRLAPAGGDPARIGVKQEDLAGMIGVSRQMTNKLLKQLQRQGAIGIHYGAVSIEDVAVLSSNIQHQ